METKQRVEFEVVGGMCRLQFDPGYSTGSDDETNPGIGFSLIANGQKLQSHHGVFARSDARRLRDMLDLFLAGL